MDTKGEGLGIGFNFVIHKSSYIMCIVAIE